MFYIVFDFMMAVIMFLFGMWFYKSEGKATKFLSGYNMKSADERKKYDENAMCKAYGKLLWEETTVVNLNEKLNFHFDQ